MHHHLSQEEVTNTLHRFTEQYPDITRLYSVGKSVQGRDLWVIEISDQPVFMNQVGNYIFKFIQS